MQIVVNFWGYFFLQIKRSYFSVNFVVFRHDFDEKLSGFTKFKDIVIYCTLSLHPQKFVTSDVSATLRKRVTSALEECQGYKKIIFSKGNLTVIADFQKMQHDFSNLGVF